MNSRRQALSLIESGQGGSLPERKMKGVTKRETEEGNFLMNSFYEEGKGSLLLWA